MTAKAHHPGQPADAEESQSTEVAEDQNQVGAGDTHEAATQVENTTAGPDLANVDTSTYHSSPLPPYTAPEVFTTSASAAAKFGGERQVSDETLAEADETPLVELKALGNTKADVNITAVRNAHGTFTWTARDADGTELARSPHPHTEPTLVANLQKLFAGSVVALRRTGDDKARRLA